MAVRGGQGRKKYRSTCRGRGRRDGGDVFFLKTPLAPRLAIVAREKNGKTIFCRFAPSSPLSLLYCLFFYYYVVWRNPTNFEMRQRVRQHCRKISEYANETSQRSWLIKRAVKIEHNILYFRVLVTPNPRF